MSGIDPYNYLQKVSLAADGLNTKAQIEIVLDELEYLFEVIPPEVQDNAETLIALLREKLKNVSD